MKKAVNLYFCGLDTKTKLDAIKNAGYDGVLLGVREDVETMTLEEQVKYCKAIGLEISMIHCQYLEKNLNSLWEENSKIGDEVEKDLLSQIEKIKNFGVKDFVIHTCGSRECKSTKFGLERIKRILEFCEIYNIHLCIENLYLESQVRYIFENLKSPDLKFCYDSGHDNYFSHGSSLSSDFASLITATHIHDNHGGADEHLILGRGNINQEELAKSLAKSNEEFLTAEIKYYDKSANIKDVLKENLEALNNLEQKINMHKENQ